MSQVVGKPSKAILVGADPELFIRDSATGAFVSAHDILPGSKHDPFGVEGGAIQVDGTAAEFNIWPTEDRDQFVSNIQRVTSEMLEFVRSISKKSKSTYELMAVPTAFYDKEYFKSLPDETKLLGCDIDYNAWTGKPNAKPSDKVTFRTGGGHVHVGFTEGQDVSDKAHFHDCIQMTKTLDVLLYLPSLVFDADKKRRELYGKKGSFRPKSYGVEYRPLSNFWVSDPKLIEWVFDSVQTADHMLNSEGFEIYEEKDLKQYLDPPELTPAEALEAYFAVVGVTELPLPDQYIDRFTKTIAY